MNNSSHTTLLHCAIMLRDTLTALSDYYLKECLPLISTKAIQPFLNLVGNVDSNFPGVMLNLFVCDSYIFICKCIYIYKYDRDSVYKIIYICVCV